MTSSELIAAAVLKRKAVVYVRQSTQSQVMTNLESQRRQYDLVDVARQRGFVDVEIIDDDLGRSASGTVARPGRGTNGDRSRVQGGTDVSRTRGRPAEDPGSGTAAGALRGKLGRAPLCRLRSRQSSHRGTAGEELGDRAPPRPRFGGTSAGRKESGDRSRSECFCQFGREPL